MGTSLSSAATALLTYVKDNLKLYMPFGAISGQEVKFVGQGSTSFDGTQDFIDCGRDSSLDIGTNDFTVAFWVKLGALGINHALVSKGSRGGGGKRFEIKITTGNKLYFEIDNNTAEASKTCDTALALGVWHHYGVTFDRDGNGQAYLDGVDDGSVDISSVSASINDTGKDLCIGIASDDETSDDFNGNMKNVGIWTRALSQTEIQNVMYKTYGQLLGTETQGLVSWWSLAQDDDVIGIIGTAAIDRTNANIGTVSGATYNNTVYGGDTPKIPRAVDNAPTARADTIGNGSASFTDDNDDYIALGYETSISGDWTVSAWVKPTVVNYRAIVASSKEVQTLVGFSGTDDIIVRLEKASGTSYWYDNWDPGFADWSTTDWFHLAVTKVGTAVTPYLNGIIGTAGTLNGSDGVLKVRAIGIMFADDDIQYKFDGNIAQLGIWSAALTQAQIQEVKEKSFGELSASDKTNLVSYWSLDAGVDATTTGTALVYDEVNATLESTPTVDSTANSNTAVQTLNIPTSMAKDVVNGAVYKMTLTMAEESRVDLQHNTITTGSNVVGTALAVGEHVVYVLIGDTTLDRFRATVYVENAISHIKLEKVNGNAGRLL